MTKLISLYFASLVAIVAFGGIAAASELNVYGKPLQSCSQSGMAKTGFTRTGLCEDYDTDKGSHNVCIDIPSSKGGNFCTVTGQPNWCDDDKECHDQESGICPIQHWCVCEWAFESYLETAGGCDQIAEIVCESTNHKAILHYEEAIAHKGDKKAEAALACLEERCGEMANANR